MPDSESRRLKKSNINQHSSALLVEEAPSKGSARRNTDLSVSKSVPQITVDYEKVELMISEGTKELRSVLTGQL